MDRGPHRLGARIRHRHARPGNLLHVSIVTQTAFGRRLRAEDGELDQRQVVFAGPHRVGDQRRDPFQRRVLPVGLQRIAVGENREVECFSHGAGNLVADLIEDLLLTFGWRPPATVAGNGAPR